ncbi:hypothetical protein C8J57DRAFT_1404364 [Mycena rebaudengoi]|nr:hypothetical protein C8J57DRAFT_1404364 [Mycena rebaudengoi]
MAETVVEVAWRWWRGRAMGCRGRSSTFCSVASSSRAAQAAPICNWDPVRATANQCDPGRRWSWRDEGGGGWGDWEMRRAWDVAAHRGQVRPLRRRRGDFVAGSGAGDAVGDVASQTHVAAQRHGVVRACRAIRLVSYSASPCWGGRRSWCCQNPSRTDRRTPRVGRAHGVRRAI